MTSEHNDRIYPNRQTAAAVCHTYRGWEPVEVPSGWIIAQTFKTIDAARAKANELAARFNDIYAIMPTEDQYFLLLGKFCQELLHRPYQTVAVYIAYPSEQRETHPSPRIYETAWEAARAAHGIPGCSAVRVPAGWIVTRIFSDVSAARAAARDFSKMLLEPYMVAGAADGYIVVETAASERLFHRWHTLVSMYTAYPDDIPEDMPSIDWKQVGTPLWRYGDGSVSAKVYQNQQFWLRLKPDWEWMVLMAVTETVLHAKTPEQEDVNVTAYRQFAGSADTADDAKRQAEECIAKHRKESA